MIGPPQSKAERVLEALATSLGARVREQRQAEERLAGFAFREAGPAAVAAGTGGAEPAPIPDWRYYLARTLREASEPATLALLLRLHSDGASLRDLGHDHFAVADQIGRLATAGLVSRPLDSERVSLAPLGAAVLELYHELEARLSAAEERAR